MHDEKTNDVREMKDRLICEAKTDLADCCSCCTPEKLSMLGQVVDMIKDLAETEKSCAEAKYYKSVYEAMEEYGEYDDRRGYNNRRYANGEYAPAGRGHLGYMEPPYMDAMGYTRSGEGNRSQSGNNMSRMGYYDGYYGRPFEEFRNAKRNYTTTHSESDKKKMHDHANEHIMNSVTTIREIWDDADPELKQRIRTDMTNLVNEMNM